MHRFAFVLVTVLSTLTAPVQAAPTVVGGFTDTFFAAVGPLPGTPFSSTSVTSIFVDDGSATALVFPPFFDFTPLGSGPGPSDHVSSVRLDARNPGFAPLAAALTNGIDDLIIVEWKSSFDIGPTEFIGLLAPFFSSLAAGGPPGTDFAVVGAPIVAIDITIDHSQFFDGFSWNTLGTISFEFLADFGVPAPGALALLGFGLLGLCMRRRF